MTQVKSGGLSVDAASSILMQIQTDLQNNRIKTEGTMIESSKSAKKAKNKEQMEKILESIEKASKAAKSGTISKIFGFIALAVVAVITAVTAVGAAITGVGVVGAVAMGAALMIMIMQTISSQTESNFMNKIFGSSKEGQLAASIFWMAATIVLSMGSSAAASAAKGAADVASKVTKITDIIKNTMQMINATSTIAGGVSGITKSHYQYESDIAKADSKKAQADAMRLQQQIDELIESIEKALEDLQAGFSTAVNIMKADHETKTQLISKLRG